MTRPRPFTRLALPALLVATVCRGDVRPAPGARDLALPAIDALLLLEQADAQVADRTHPGPLPFAAPFEVFATPATSGTWDAAGDGSRTWRLHVHSPGATDLNFGFVRFDIPVGARLVVRAESEDYQRGPFTKDHATDGQLWTPVIPGDRALIELALPPGASEPDLELGVVGAGFRDLFNRAPLPVPKSGACNNDVVCPEGDPWRADIASVAGYSFGAWLMCTGTLINDVPRSYREFFLTADHCGVRARDAASVIVYWNYETTTCGGPRDGQLADAQTGSTLRASRSDVDMMLLELSEDPDPAFGVYYAGWDRSDLPPAGSIGIHHPNGDEKAITFNDDPLTFDGSCIANTTNTHWRISQYEDGTTEPGSSGSGLWDPAHRLIGTLSGGAASCAIIDYDCYGRFGRGWDGSAPASRLRDWLDPDNTAVERVDGTYPGGPPCTGQEIAAADLRVRKGAGNALVLTFTPAVTACALGEQVRMSASARPAGAPATFPDNPAFVDVSSQDMDGGPVFRHATPAGNAWYLVVEALPGGLPGPSGSYGY